MEPSSQHDSRIPATNSNGDYVTTIVDSYTDSEIYTSSFTLNGALTSSPATYIKIVTYTEVTAAHYGPVKSVNYSTTAEIWDRERFVDCGLPGFPLRPSLCNTAWRSFTSYGREPACTAAYSSFLATGPLKTAILDFCNVIYIAHGNPGVHPAGLESPVKPSAGYPIWCPV